MYLLDTDTLIYWLNGNQKIEQKALHVGLDHLYYSIISKAELYFGAYNSSSVQQNLSNIQTLSQKLSMRPFDDKAAEFFGQIKSDPDRDDRGEILSDRKKGDLPDAQHRDHPFSASAIRYDDQERGLFTPGHQSTRQRREALAESESSLPVIQ